MKKLGIAIVGLGWIARRVYLPILCRHDGLQLRAAFDVSETIRTAVGAEYGVNETRRTLEACLADDVDGVILCTPPQSHGAYLTQLTGAGKHVLCEKPVFVNNRDAAELASSRTASELVMGSATMRLRDDAQRLLSTVATGALGTIQHVRLGWWRARGVPSPGSWRTTAAESPLGVMEDLGPHLLDIVADMAGHLGWAEVHVQELSLGCRYGAVARGAGWFNGSLAQTYDAPDWARASLRSKSGPIVDIEVCWASEHPGDWCSIQIDGTGGTAEYKGLFGFSEERLFPEQYCCITSAGFRQVHRFPCGLGLQHNAFARSVDIFSGFCRGECEAMADHADIFRVTSWLTEMSNLYSSAPKRGCVVA